MSKQSYSYGLAHHEEVGLLKKLLVAAGVAATIGVTSGSALAAPVLPDFTINQTTVSNCTTAVGFGFTPCVFTADKMTGNYNEVFTVTGVGQFSTTAYWDLGQYVSNDGTAPVANSYLNNGINNPAVLDGYSIYGLFSSTGTFVPSGGGFVFTGVTGCIQVFVDPLQNGYAAGNKTLPAASPAGVNCAPNPVTVAGNGEDVLLASATLFKGEGSTASGLANGDFGLEFNPFTLTAAGSAFFTAPNPFYVDAILKGQFNSFNPVVGASQTINGSADAFFQVVPEPGTLSLLGIGLLGLARGYRNRRKA